MSLTQTTQFTQQRVLSKHRWIGALVATVWLAGCSTVSTAPPPAPAVQPLAQYMQEADQALAGGSREGSRELYRTAARHYPTSKEPWLELAEDYFEVADYGQAILASQEVLQRDPGDHVATSVLAVSGLRLSATALSMLRQGNLSPNARTEAEGLARTLREVLGEPVLVPRPAVEAAPAPAPPSAKPKTATRARRSAAKSAPPARKPAATDNPFNLLKK